MCVSNSVCVISYVICVSQSGVFNIIVSLCLPNFVCLNVSVSNVYFIVYLVLFDKFYARNSVCLSLCV